MTGRSISFGVFADAHCGPESYGKRRCGDGPAKLGSCAEVFNRRDLSMCVNLGDSIDVPGGRETALRWLAAVNRSCGRFRGEMHVLLGNHDLAQFTKKEFFDNCAAEVSLPFYSFDREGFHFVVLDGNCLENGADFARGSFEWTDSWVSAEQIGWLEDDLAKAADSLAVVFCHEDLDDRTVGGIRERHVVCNAGDVRSTLDRAGNVAVVIQGHCHGGGYAVVNGIPYVTLTALADGRKAPCGIVTLDENGGVMLEGFSGQPDRAFDPAKEP